MTDLHFHFSSFAAIELEVNILTIMYEVNISLNVSKKNTVALMSSIASSSSYVPFVTFYYRCGNTHAIIVRCRTCSLLGSLCSLTKRSGLRNFTEMLNMS